MKNLLKYILLIICFLFSGCANLSLVKPASQMQIDKTEEKLKDNAKSLLSAAKNILDKMDNSNPELAKAISILEDTQVALGTNISESKELKGLSEQKFNEVIVTINNENKKLLTELETLNDKNKEFVSEMLTENIKSEAIRKHEQAKSIKFYATCSVIIAIIGGLAFLFPTQSMGVVSSVFGIFKK
jgi:hypothetical protein